MGRILLSDILGRRRPVGFGRKSYPIMTCSANDPHRSSLKKTKFYVPYLKEHTYA
jgi:hypothetical protein